MNRHRFAALLAQRFKINQSEAQQILSAVFEEVKREAIAQGICQVRGFGTFRVVRRAARNTPLRRDPTQKLAVPAHQRLTLSERLD